MGLFGFVKRALGSVIKTGLGVATHGVSNQIFDFMDARKRQQHLQPIADRFFDVKPKVRGGYRPKKSLGFSEQIEETGETPGERNERLRLLRLKKKRAKQSKARALDFS